RMLPGLPAEQRAPTLDALSRRLTEEGEPRASLAAAFEAKRTRRAQRADMCGEDSLFGCAASEAEWWLWTWPTRNGSELILTPLLLLWCAMVLVGLPRGRLLLTTNADASADPSWRCVDRFEDASCPIGALRVRTALQFATRLVLKIGSSRAYLANPVSAGT